MRERRSARARGSACKRRRRRGEGRGTGPGAGRRSRPRSFIAMNEQARTMRWRLRTRLLFQGDSEDRQHRGAVKTPHGYRLEVLHAFEDELIRPVSSENEHHVPRVREAQEVEARQELWPDLG